MINISGSIFKEADFFVVSMFSGCLMVFVYDVLRVLRRLLSHGTVLIAIEDILYWIFCAFFIFAMLYQKNEGLIRGFAIGAILLGMLLYNHFISPRVIKGVVWLAKKVLWIISTPFRLAKKLLKRPTEFVRRKSAKMGKKVKKLLKKAYKAGKMILYKH